MPQIYEVWFLPWVDNSEGKPWKYSGSNHTDNVSYLGSPSSKLIYDWTDGLTVGKWWKKKTRSNPELFVKHILIECSSSISRQELQSLESKIQQSEDHRNNNQYFNKTNKHFNSPHINSSATKGMTYEEIYGKEKAKELKIGRSKSSKEARSRKNWTGNKTGFSHNKNKTYEECYGAEKAAEMKSSRFIPVKGTEANLRALARGNHVSQQKLLCDYCSMLVDKANYARWHGEKCKCKDSKIS
jgi:hypothetical protein